MATDAAATSAIDQEKMQELLGRVVGDFGATASAALVVIGDRLGLYKALAHYGPLTSAALADDTNPLFVAGGFELFISLVKDEEHIGEAFRSGSGMHWGEHHPGLFRGTERFFRPGYLANLVQYWIPALTGVQEKLESGVTVADVGCGYGASTQILARAFPQSRFFGFDNHPASIERARQEAAEAGLGEQLLFEVASATDFPGTGYDLITYFDCLHDMGDPVGAMRHAREVIAPDGAVLLVEPMAGDTVEENFNPVGRIYSAASVLVCTPNAIASGPVALGTLATEAALRSVAEEAGFARFRRAMDTPFNRLFEVRPS